MYAVCVVWTTSTSVHIHLTEERNIIGFTDDAEDKIGGL